MRIDIFKINIVNNLEERRVSTVMSHVLY